MSTTNPVAGNQYFTRVTNSTSKFLDLNASNISGTNIDVGAKFKESFDLITSSATTQAISLNTVVTLVNTTTTGDVASLAAGVVGQVKTIATNPAGAGTAVNDVLAVTLTGNPGSFDLLTLTVPASKNAFADLIYTGSTNGWVVVHTIGGALS